MRILFLHSAQKCAYKLLNTRMYADLIDKHMNCVPEDKWDDLSKSQKSKCIKLEELPRKCLLGMLLVSDSFWFDEENETILKDEWATGPFCYKIYDVYKFDTPIEDIRGMMGFWKLKDVSAANVKNSKHFKSINKKLRDWDKTHNIFEDVAKIDVLKDISCISIQQPFAKAVIEKIKKIENRSKSMGRVSNAYIEKPDRVVCRFCSKKTENSKKLLLDSENKHFTCSCAKTHGKWNRKSSEKKNKSRDDARAKFEQKEGENGANKSTQSKNKKDQTSTSKIKTRSQSKASKKSVTRGKTKTKSKSKSKSKTKRKVNNVQVNDVKNAKDIEDQDEKESEEEEDAMKENKSGNSQEKVKFDKFDKSENGKNKNKKQLTLESFGYNTRSRAKKRKFEDNFNDSNNNNSSNSSNSSNFNNNNNNNSSNSSSSSSNSNVNALSQLNGLKSENKDDIVIDENFDEPPKKRRRTLAKRGK